MCAARTSGNPADGAVASPRQVPGSVADGPHVKVDGAPGRADQPPRWIVVLLHANRVPPVAAMKVEALTVNEGVNGVHVARSGVLLVARPQLVVA